jgi:hypothetical protein
MPRRGTPVTPEQKYEALKSRLEAWASGQEHSGTPLTEAGQYYKDGQRDLAEALLEFCKGLEER